MSKPIIPPIEGTHLPAAHTVRNLPDIDRIEAMYRNFNDAGMLKFT